MKYNFETYPKRWGINASKWAPLEKTKYGFADDIAPFSTADMDLYCCPEIIEEVTRRAQLGVYGYGEAGPDFYEATVNWMKERHGWDAKKEWLQPFAGVVAAVFHCVQAYTEVGDEVIIQTPVYFPFHAAVMNNNRKLVYNELKIENGRYVMDYDDLEEKCKTAKMLILCSPHNPVGRVWTEEELRRLGDICNKNGVVVIADEIHHDLVFEPHVQVPYATLGKEYEQNCVITTAASKTFNLAAFNTSCIFIPNPELRKKFDKVAGETGSHYNSYMGPAATVTAFTKGGPWLDELLVHLKGNFDYLKSFLNEKIPEVKVFDLEGTYLVWMDFRCFGLNKDELEKFMTEECGLFLDEGYVFGECGAGYERINIACTRKVLADALDRLYEGAKKRGFVK